MNSKQNYNWNIQWRGKLNYCLGGLPRLGAESRGRWRLVGITQLMSSEGCRISQHPPEAGIIQPPLSIGGWVYSALLPCIGQDYSTFSLWRLILHSFFPMETGITQPLSTGGQIYSALIIWGLGLFSLCLLEAGIIQPKSSGGQDQSTLEADITQFFTLEEWITQLGLLNSRPLVARITQPLSLEAGLTLSLSS